MHSTPESHEQKFNRKPIDKREKCSAHAPSTRDTTDEKFMQAANVFTNRNLKFFRSRTG